MLGAAEIVGRDDGATVGNDESVGVADGDNEWTVVSDIDGNSDAWSHVGV